MLWGTEDGFFDGFGYIIYINDCALGVVSLSALYIYDVELGWIDIDIIL